MMRNGKNKNLKKNTYYIIHRRKQKPFDCIFALS